MWFKLFSSFKNPSDISDFWFNPGEAVGSKALDRLSELNLFALLSSKSICLNPSNQLHQRTEQLNENTFENSHSILPGIDKPQREAQRSKRICPF